LPVVTLDAGLEAMIVQGMVDPVTGQPLIEPDLARTVGERVAQLLADRGPAAPPVAMIVQPRLRRALAGLLRLRAPGCVVMSIAELPETQPVEVICVARWLSCPPPQLPAPGSGPFESMAA
jgi:flagellar biosynthesis protein FlhA